MALFPRNAREGLRCYSQQPVSRPSVGHFMPDQLHVSMRHGKPTHASRAVASPG